jgi:hypothetical protein
MFVEGNRRIHWTHDEGNKSEQSFFERTLFNYLCNYPMMLQNAQQFNTATNPAMQPDKPPTISLFRGRCDSLSDAFLEILQRSLLQSLHLLLKLLGAFLGSAQDLIPGSKRTARVLRANMLSTRNLALFSWSESNQDVEANVILCGSRWEKYRLHSRP